MELTVFPQLETKKPAVITAGYTKYMVPKAGLEPVKMAMITDDK